MKYLKLRVLREKIFFDTQYKVVWVKKLPIFESGCTVLRGNPLFNVYFTWDF